MARMFSEEQIAMANSVDIASFLQMQGEALIKSGKDMRWARHTSITVRGNRFYDWKAEAGGYPIAFVQRYFNYNFKQAVEFLLSNVGDFQMSVPYLCMHTFFHKEDRIAGFPDPPDNYGCFFLPGDNGRLFLHVFRRDP